MVRLLSSVALAFALTAPAFAQSELRWIVPNKSAGGGWVLWTSWESFNTCTRAIMRGTPADQRMFCKDGFSGIKPQVGELDPGTLVERLESRTCRDMVNVRVGTGPFKGETGCIGSNALTSIKPDEPEKK